MLKMNEGLVETIRGYGTSPSGSTSLRVYGSGLLVYLTGPDEYIVEHPRPIIRIGATRVRDFKLERPNIGIHIREDKPHKVEDKPIPDHLDHTEWLPGVKGSTLLKKRYDREGKEY